MITQTPWFERRFSFHYPIGFYPVFLERLRGAAPRLEEITRGLTPEILTNRFGGKWSILEEVGHLIDLDSLHDGRIDDYLADKSILRAADLQNKLTETANHNSRKLVELLEAFRNRRREFVQRLEEFDEAAASKSALHPRLNQPMRLVDMVFFVAEHDDHHIAKIRELITRQK